MSAESHLFPVQGPSLDLWDLTSKEGMDCYKSVADVIQGMDDETMRTTMEAALGQHKSSIGSDFYSALPRASAAHDCTPTFQNWLPQDNVLCNVQS